MLPETMLAQFLTRAASAPESAYAALGRMAHSHVGARLFTLMEFDAATGEGRRFYSNMPEAYPVSGRKPMPPTSWSETVIGNKETFAANSIEEIAKVFPDYKLIRSLGCGAVLNIPVVSGGEVLGTINCLHGTGAYGPEQIEAADDLKLPGLFCFLIEQACSLEGDRK